MPPRRRSAPSSERLEMSHSTAPDFSMYRADLTIPCPATKCSSPIGKPCRDLSPGVVHFARRLKRLLAKVGQ